jgi:putative ABC transport system permease protein
VSQRRKEIGIRVALGASARRLLAGIFARAGGQLGLGVAFGIAIGMGADLLSGGTLFGKEGAVLMPTMAVIMVCVGLLAALGPARRGLRVQPTQALRDE